MNPRRTSGRGVTNHGAGSRSSASPKDNWSLGRIGDQSSRGVAVGSSHRRAADDRHRGRAGGFGPRPAVARGPVPLGRDGQSRRHRRVGRCRRRHRAGCEAGGIPRRNGRLCHRLDRRGWSELGGRRGGDAGQRGHRSVPRRQPSGTGTPGSRHRRPWRPASQHRRPGRPASQHRRPRRPASQEGRRQDDRRPARQAPDDQQVAPSSEVPVGGATTTPPPGC